MYELRADLNFVRNLQMIMKHRNMNQTSFARQIAKQKGKKFTEAQRRSFSRLCNGDPKKLAVLNEIYAIAKVLNVNPGLLIFCPELKFEAIVTRPDPYERK